MLLKLFFVLILMPMDAITLNPYEMRSDQSSLYITFFSFLKIPQEYSTILFSSIEN